VAERDAPHPRGRAGLGERGRGRAGRGQGGCAAALAAAAAVGGLRSGSQLRGGGGCGAQRGSGYRKQPGGKSQSARAGRGGAAEGGTRPRRTSRALAAPGGGAAPGRGPGRWEGGTRPHLEVTRGVAERGAPHPPTPGGGLGWGSVGGGARGGAMAGARRPQQYEACAWGPGREEEDVARDGEVVAENSQEVRARERGPGGSARQTEGLGPAVHPGNQRRHRGRGWRAPWPGRGLVRWGGGVRPRP
jgi:hypothetical protein